MTEQMSKSEKRKIAMKVMDAINKTEPTQAVGFAKDVVKPLEFLRLPSEELNTMLGGGIARRRITEIFGNNSSGKTSIILEAIGEDMAENPDNLWAWLESEESFDLEYAVDIHEVDPDRLIYIDITDSGAEKSIDRLEALMRAGVLTGFVINSVAGLVPKKELEEDLEKPNIALQARMMSKLMRKWTGLIGKKNLYAVFINQLRTDIGVRFGDPSVTTGGRALAYYASQRFGMNRFKLQEADPLTEDVGMKIGARTAKNRCVYDNPYKKCEFYVIYGEGVDKLTELIDKAPEAGILRKSGAWYYYEQEDGELIEAKEAVVKGKTVKNFPMKLNGRAALRTFLNENPWFMNQLKEEIRDKVKRGELTATYQTEEEMKEIEKLNAIEKEIAAEEEAPKKEKAKPKATKEKKPAAKNKKAPAKDKKTSAKKEPSKAADK